MTVWSPNLTLYYFKFIIYKTHICEWEWPPLMTFLMPDRLFWLLLGLIFFANHYRDHRLFGWWDGNQVKFGSSKINNCVFSNTLKLWILQSKNCIIIDFLKRNMKNPESPNLIWFPHLIVEFFALRWNWPSAFRRTHWSRCWSDSKSKKSNILKRFHSKLSIRFSKWTTKILASLDLIQSV